MNDLIKREDAIRAVSEPFDRKYWQYTTRSIRDTVKALKDIPAVEPWDIYNPDEWCTDCKEYDTENHRCPRWNKMIRKTIEENQPKQGEWIDRTTLKGFPEYECSACHAYGQQWMTFCPHCGVRMVKK